MWGTGSGATGEVGHDWDDEEKVTDDQPMLLYSHSGGGV